MKSIAEKIKKIQSQLGQQVELSRPAPPTRTLDVTIAGHAASIPIYDEGHEKLEVQCGTLTDVVISATDISLTVEKSDGEICCWMVTPDTRMVLLS
jgi:hypothetical protein